MLPSLAYEATRSQRKLFEKHDEDDPEGGSGKRSCRQLTSALQALPG